MLDDDADARKRRLDKNRDDSNSGGHRTRTRANTNLVRRDALGFLSDKLGAKMSRGDEDENRQVETLFDSGAAAAAVYRATRWLRRARQKAEVQKILVEMRRRSRRTRKFYLAKSRSLSRAHA